MHEVSARTIEFVRAACERERVAFADVEPRSVRGGEALDWDALVELLARYRRAVRREASLTDLGARVVDSDAIEPLRALAGALASPRLLYRAFATWAVPSVASVVGGRFEDVDERHVRLEFEIAAGRRESREVLEAIAGACGALTRLFDLDDARVVEANLDGRRAELVVELPEPGADAARGQPLAITGAERLLDALEAQASALRARTEAAERARRDLVAMLGHTPQPTFVLRGERIVFANEAFAALLGRPAAALEGAPLLELVEKDDRARVSRLLAGELPTVDARITALGVASSIELSAPQPIGEPGEGLRVAFARATPESGFDPERALRCALVEHGRDFIAATDLAGRVRFLNAAGARLLGLSSADDAIGRTLDELSTDAARARLLGEELPAVVRDGAWTGPSELRTADGRAILVEASSFLVRVGDEPRWIGTIRRDARDTRALEEDLSRARRLESLGRMAGGIAHDFNNVLTTIAMHADVLLETTPESSSGRADLEQIRQATERAATMTKSLLAFGRKQPAMPRPLALDEAVRAVEPLVRRLVGPEIEVEVRASRGLVVRVDASHVERVVTNLAINARDAMPEGGRLLVEVASVVLGERDARGLDLVPGPYARLRVRDDGTGMDEETRARIFDPFFTTKKPAEGTGLGLAIVDGFVRQAGGAVRVESAPGRGSVFDVFLPRDPTDSNAAHPDSVATRATETVLVVEDEAPIRSAVRRTLQRSGYVVLEAADGVEALELVRGHTGPLHLVITDVRMPRLGGPALAESLRDVLPDVPVLFMSGYAEDLPEARDIPVGKLLTKPFAPATLISIVRDLLDGDRSRRHRGVSRASGS